jgi:hypothetical protein
MRIYEITKLVFPSLILCTNLIAREIHYNRENKVFLNVNCEISNTCDLREFTLNKTDFEITFRGGEKSYGTSVHALYKTKKISDLTNYVVVQMIRGCHFESRIENGEKVVGISNHREYFNEIIPFYHKDWMIDSIDLDPAYNSEPGLPRHYYYKWNRTRNSYAKRSEVFYFQQLPPRAELYIGDIPGTAFEQDGYASNISLEFKTCLFKNVDVPFIIDPNDVNFQEPISCHEWSSSFIYDHETEKFDSPKGISPHCDEVFSPIENNENDETPNDEVTGDDIEDIKETEEEPFDYLQYLLNLLRGR